MHQFIFSEFVISSSGLSQCLFVILIPFELYGIIQLFLGLLWYFWFYPFALLFAIFFSFLSLRPNFVQILVVNWGIKWILWDAARWTRLAQPTKWVDHLRTPFEQASLGFLFIWWTVWNRRRLIVGFYLQLWHLYRQLTFIILALLPELLLILLVLSWATVHRTFDIIFVHLLMVILAWSSLLLQHKNVIINRFLKLNIFGNLINQTNTKTCSYEVL